MAPAFSRFSRRFSVAPERQLAQTSAQLPPSRASLRLPPSLLMVSAGLADFLSFLNHREHGKIAESVDMGLGEAERCAEKREKAGGELRYELIGAK